MSFSLYNKRFHAPAREPALDYDVILPLDDDIQLSVAEYRNKLYEMILERKINTRRQKRETLKESADPMAKHSEEPSCVQAKEDTEAPMGNTGSVPGSLSHTVHHTTDCVTAPAGQSDTLQSAPKPKPPIYNPITHSVTQSGSGHWRGGTAPKKSGCQPSQEQNSSSQPGMHGVNKNVEPRGKTAPVIRARSFSLTQQARAAAPNHLLTRKEAAPKGAVSVAAVSARLNQRTPIAGTRELRSAQKFSRKMFQGTNNIGTAGDPKASLQSYTQAYGTISKSALQSLPLQSCSNGEK
ncbi:mitogen-activated protein kinase 15-like [Pseudophryne corroboree]|uniref:mitogen-activated protein kinase 15-like n=1 Tax=Pseudophryne corroboree TaxID=495146 RepID=UPI00308178CD